MIVLKNHAAPSVLVRTILAAAMSFLYCMATAISIVVCDSDSTCYYLVR